MSLEERIENQIKERIENNTLRKLTQSDGEIDFTSNDYLGLAQSAGLAAMIKQNCDELKLPSGSTGSRLLSGNNLITEQLEQKLGTLFRGEALLFNSGYTANLGVLSTLPHRGDTIIYDELAHACIKDGARLSLANRYSFRHNDLNDLEIKLKKAKGNIFIVIESIYSMDGDESPLSEIAKLAKQYSAIIILDEAHSTGVMGDNGNGLACQLNITEGIGIRIYTFGKAMGVHGACVVASKKIKEYLINFARPFIYTTALPPHSIVSIESSFEFLLNNIHLQKKLTDKINLFNSLLTIDTSHRVSSKSAIQSILINSNDRVKEAAQILQQKNLDCRPIVSPTVKEGTERIRICLHEFNTDEEIKLLTNALNQLSL